MAKPSPRSDSAIQLPAEAADVAEALRIADQRMYAQKNAGRTSASRQSKDVLLRALAERNPELRNHLSGTAELAEATALRLGLSHDIVEQVRHAAELHDVGKVAVPDAILTKPGPLDELERCAGSQFDPGVVAAFRTAWLDRSLAAAA